MICQYCRTQNAADDHRCSRCGRRLSDEPVHFPVVRGGAAPKLETVEAPVPVVSQPQLQAVPRGTVADGPREAVQAPLFPAAPVGPRAQQQQKAAPAKEQKRKADPRMHQQHFEFGEGPRALPTSVEAAVYCSAPVAEVPYRLTAAVIDTLIPLAGVGMFLLVAHYMVGDIPLDKSTAPFFGLAAGLIVLFYRLVCCLGNMDTPGLQWAGLRLLDFDGRLPTRRARFFRLTGGLVSLVSVGMGAAWALGDEERLTWHDYMSRTFPTPRFR